MTARYGWYGDDFTGATDTLATIAQRGHRAFLFLNVPTAARLAAMPVLDAIGIAGAARSMTPDRMLDELAPVGAFFRDLGVRLMHYKCCSTFDSGVTTGNLATAIAVLRGYTEDPRVAIVGGQPSLGRYCAFSNLFAMADDAVHRLDRHPTMCTHPATPMAESDLRLHLERLGECSCAAIHWTGMAQAQTRWAAIPAGTALFDAMTQTHIDQIGACLRDSSALASLLVVGPSSVAEAFFGGNTATGKTPAASGPVLGFAGSLSAKTRRQIELARRYTHLATPPEVITDPIARATVAAKAAALLRSGTHVLLNSAMAPNGPQPDLARNSALLVAEILKQAPVKRFALAGGDTSSHIVMGLGLWGLSFLSRIADGVTVCEGRSDDPARDRMVVMLKGGQMGDDLLFDRFATPASGAYA